MYNTEKNGQVVTEGDYDGRCRGWYRTGILSQKEVKVEMIPPYIEFVPGKVKRGQIYITFVIFNRVGIKKDDETWGKENDSVSSIDINLFWHVYDDIFKASNIKFDHYFLVYSKETERNNKVNGEKESGFIAVIDS